MVMIGRILTLVALLVLLAPDAHAFVLSTKIKAPEVAELAPSETSRHASMSPCCIGQCPGSICLPALVGTDIVLAAPATAGATVGDANRTRGDPADRDIVTPPPKATV